MKKEYKVYMYENQINHKKYVGQTKNDLSIRAGANGYRYSHCPHFQLAIQKYGQNNFVPTILKDNLTLEEANYQEFYYINLQDLKNSEKGYNINSGGDNSDENFIQKQSELRKKQQKEGLYEGVKKPIYCIELDKIFNSLKEAGEYFNINPSSLSQTCQGKNRYCGVKDGKPLHQCYLENKTEKLIKELKDRQENLGRNGHGVYCIELNKEFKSASEAARYVGLKDSKSIRKACEEHQRTAGVSSDTNIKLHQRRIEDIK